MHATQPAGPAPPWRSDILVRNAIYNIAAQAIPAVLAVATLPYVVRGLGVERFGILSVAWLLLSYLAMLDLGLGRATTKLVAEALAHEDRAAIARIGWTTGLAQLAVGAAGAAALALTASLLAERVFEVPPDLITETVTTLYWLAAGIIAVLAFGTLRAMLEAAQRFDLVSTVGIVFNGANYLIPVAGVAFGWTMPIIVAALVGARFAAVCCLALLTGRVFPELRRTLSFDRRELARAFAFGRWTFVSRLVVPVFVYLDRFVIAALLPLSALTFYTVPYEAVTRLLIIPSSAAAVLFPAFSTLASAGADERIRAGATRSTKFIIVSMLPIVFLLGVFADELLGLWLGADFVAHSADVVRLLALAVFLNSIGHVPYALLEGCGRPDVITKYHALELPIYATVLWLLTRDFGLVGAAGAWCLRMAWTIPIFYVLALRATGTAVRGVLHSLTPALLTALGVFGVGAWLSTHAGLPPGVEVGFAGAAVTACLAVAWFLVLDSADRAAILALSRPAGLRRQGVAGD